MTEASLFAFLNDALIDVEEATARHKATLIANYDALKRGVINEKSFRDNARYLAEELGFEVADTMRRAVNGNG